MAEKSYHLLSGDRLQIEDLNGGFKTATANRSFAEVITRTAGGSRSIERSPVQAGGVPSSLRKFGLLGGQGSNIHSRTNFLEPQIRDPLLSASNFYLPTDRVLMNAWIRYFDRFHPIVGNAIDMHATVPFSKFQLKDIDDPGVRRFYEDMVTETNLFRRILEISREFELLGEVFPFAYWDDEMNAFSDIVILNPDSVEVVGMYIAGEDTWRYELIPDPTVLAFLRSENPLDWEIVQELDPAIIRAAQTDTNAPLDPFNVSHLARRQSPYDDRGTSIIMGCIKDLLYEEQLLEAQYAITGGIVRPREIWKLGIPGEYMPTDKDLQDLRDLLGASEYDPNFAIISHHGLEVDFVGADRRILPIIPERKEIEARLLTRLYTNKAVTHGEGPTFANASVAMQFIAARYATKRDFITEWIRDAIFLPTSLANEFYKPLAQHQVEGAGPWIRTSNRDRELVIPDFQWLSLVDLTDKGQKLQYAMQLGTQNRLPMKTILDLLQIDSSEVEFWLKQEEGTRLDAIYQSVRKMKEEAAARVEETSKLTGMPGAGGGGDGDNPAEEITDDLRDQSEKDEQAAAKAPAVVQPAATQTEPAQPKTEPKESGRVFGGDGDLKKKKENIFAGTGELEDLFRMGPPDDRPDTDTT